MTSSRREGLDEWFAKELPEDIIEPELRICDAHHHLWDHTTPGNPLEGRFGQKVYLLKDLLADTGSGHNVVSTGSCFHQKCKSSKSPKFSMPVLARCRFPLNHPHERPGRDLAETPPFVPCGPKKGAKNLILAKRRAAAPKYAQSSAAAGGGKGNALCGAVHLYYRCGSLRPPPGKKTAAA